MTTAQIGSEVTIHITGRLADGTLIISTQDAEPYTFVVGDEAVLPGITQALIGMRPGESKEITLTPENAFGQWREDLIIQVPRSELVTDEELQPGMGLKIRDASGATFNFLVVEVTPEVVTLDGNHPLAGQTVHFKLDLIGIRDTGQSID